MRLINSLHFNDSTFFEVCNRSVSLWCQFSLFFKMISWRTSWDFYVLSLSWVTTCNFSSAGLLMHDFIASLFLLSWMQHERHLSLSLSLSLMFYTTRVIASPLEVYNLFLFSFCFYSSYFLSCTNYLYHW